MTRHRMTTLRLAVLTVVLQACCSADSISPKTVVLGDVNVFTQRDVDALRGVHVIEGSLAIQPTSSERLDLSPLRDLQTVGVLLSIAGAAGLHDLQGLASLQRVGRYLLIANNPSLLNLRGLESLAQVERVVIQENDALADLDGLDRLSRVRVLTIEDNPQLHSLHGLEGLRTPGDPSDFDGEIVIARNTCLQNLAGLENLQSTGLLTIIGNDSLQDLSSLRSLRRVTRLLNIRDSHRLRIEAPAFSHLEECAEMQILGVMGISDLRAFGRTQFGSILIGNTDLERLTGLAPQDSLGRLSLYSNTRLEDISALSGLKQAGLLGFAFNPALTSLAPLSGCRATNLVINDCDQLVSLQGLEGIADIRYGLFVENNDRLTSLGGLRNVTSIGLETRIAGNSALCDSAIDAWARHVRFGGGFVVAGNRTCP